MMDLCELDKLAYAIADEAAASAIDSNCLLVTVNGEEWYDLDESDLILLRALARDVRYLELRGNLRRNLGCPTLVQILEDEDETPEEGA
jgi:hypothetical protein